jgi:hypothetical protein
MAARRGTRFAAALIAMWKDPMPDNRRQFRRVRLHLRVSHIQGVDTPGAAGNLWTTDVSAGGMFLHVPPSEEPPLGRPVSFELAVPPGEGYSSSGGTVSGTGKVVRVVSVGTPGVAVEFTRPLAFRF